MPRNNDLVHRLSGFIGLYRIGPGEIRIGTTRGSDRPVSVDWQVLGKSDRIGNSKTWIGTALDEVTLEIEKC